MVLEENIWFWLYRIAIAAGIMLGAKIIISIFNKTIFKIDKIAEKKGLKKLDLEEHTMKLLKTAVKYIVYFAAIMGILYVFGLDEAVFGLLTSAGILSLAIGFAAKDVVANLISGALVSIDRPFKIGDDVQIGNLEGEVKGLTLRSTKIKSFDGKYITIPNSKLATDPIVNFSRSKLRRIELDFQVPVGTNIKKVRKIIDGILGKTDWITDIKESDIIITNVDWRSISFQVRVWTRNKKLWDKKSELFEKIDLALRKSDIEIKKS